MRSAHRFTLLSLLFILFIVLAASLGTLLAKTAGTTPAQPRAIAPRGELTADERNTVEIFALTSPSVVHITTARQALNLFTLNVLEIPQGTGSGFVWDEAGHVVTNFHVIQGADAARVTLADQSTWRAKLVGVYPDRDLAVLRIDAPPERLRPIPIGESKGLKVGQKVLAIGNPFGLDQSLTTGVVSALNREIESVTGRTIRGVIQTDAAINPGNSGGPLLDSAGRLIGVNTAIYSPSGASAGIGFAIPVDEVNRIVPRLIREGRIRRPVLGIAAASPAFNKALGLPPGVAILRVDPDGPAARAGLKPFVPVTEGSVVVGDLIVAIDGIPTPDLDTLLDVLERYQPGDSVTLEVLRGTERRRVAVTLDAAAS
ncbi:S1C family serine protease [Tepidiphilus olei]|uniref:S1C family serine protease n=1 Tax=Tepidiphilus olei TaxID=2502184 RepID=UPI00115EF80B|nr:trypsin-like peptidase domain-containing protein [Tepidiphilus olei]